MVSLSQNLLESNLHAAHLNYVSHSYFGAARCIWELRAEICLGQNLHRLGWGTSLHLFRAGAASFRAACANQGHQRKQSLLKYRSPRPNLCLVDSALLARE